MPPSPFNQKEYINLDCSNLKKENDLDEKEKEWLREQLLEMARVGKTPDRF